MLTTGSAMKEGFTWGEVQEPPAMGLQAGAMSSPDDLQQVICCRTGVNLSDQKFLG
jgi:hypothetical protein